MNFFHFCRHVNCCFIELRKFSSFTNPKKATPSWVTAKSSSLSGSTILELQTCVLDATVWDQVLLEPDPTLSLRIISRRSLARGPDGQLIDPGLGWLAKMITNPFGDHFHADEASDAQISASCRPELPVETCEGPDSNSPDLSSRSYTRPPGKILIDHVIQVVRQAPCRRRVRWAALLHDVGKPDTAAVITPPQGREERMSFHRHEQTGAEVAMEVLAQYGYPPDFCREVATLVYRSGSFREVERFTDHKVRRVANLMGHLFHDLVQLYRADFSTRHPDRQRAHQARADRLLLRMEEAVAHDRRQARAYPLNGEELISLSGVAHGFEVAQLAQACWKDFDLRGPYSREEATRTALRLLPEFQDCRLPVRQRRTPPPAIRAVVPLGIEWAAEALGNDAAVFYGWAARERQLQGMIFVLRPMSACSSDKAAGGLAGDEADLERASEVEAGVGLDGDGEGADAGDEEAQDGLLSCGGGRFTEAEWCGQKVLRLVAMHPLANLYSLAKTVAHAFHLDFHGRFSIHRRSRTRSCAGAAAAALCATRRGQAINCKSASYGKDDDRGWPERWVFGGLNDGEDWAASEMRLLASTEGVPAMVDDKGGIFRYDMFFCAESQRWTCQSDPDSFKEGDSSTSGAALWMEGKAASFPLRVPQTGPASISALPLVTLFDRSRRSAVVELDKGSGRRQAFLVRLVESRSISSIHPGTPLGPGPGLPRLLASVGSMSPLT